MNLIINSNRARKFSFLSKRPLPTNKPIGPFSKDLLNLPAFRLARDRGLITVIKSPPAKRAPKQTPQPAAQKSSGTTSDIPAKTIMVVKIDNTEADTPFTPIAAAEVVEPVVTDTPPAAPKEDATDALKELSEKNISDIKVAIMGGDIDVPAFLEIEKANKNRVSLISFLEQLN